MSHCVLISAAGTGTAFGIVTSLRRTWGEQVRIITADINPAHLATASVFADRHLEVPLSSDENFLPTVRRCIQSEEVDTYVPLLNAEFIHAHALSIDLPSCDIWSSALIAGLVRSKRATSTWLASHGLPVPPSLSLSEISLDGNYFVKPDNGSGSHGARRASGLEVQALDLSNFVVQQVCDEPEITVDSFFDISTGRCRAVARERIEVKSGVSTKVRVYEDPVLTKIAGRIGESLKQKGSICFQVMSLNGEYAITDLNFRPGAGTAMSAATGIDLVSASFACRWGEDYSPFLAAKLPYGGLYVTRQYAEFVMPGELS